MKIASETSFVDQSGSGGSSGSCGKEMITDTESSTAEGDTGEFTRLNQMKEPKKENILELVDKCQDARVPPLILFLSQEKADQSPKQRKVLHLPPSSPNNNNDIDSLVLESTGNTSSDVVNSLHLSSPEFKCDGCPSAFSTNQELLLHDLEEHFSGEIEHKNGEKVIDCNKFGCEKKDAGGQVTYPPKVGRPSSITQEQLSALKSNYSVNKYPRREDRVQIAEAVGLPYKKVVKWFKYTRANDIRGRTGNLPSHRKCPDCDEIISKFKFGRHKIICAGRKDLREVEHEVKNEDVVVKMRQEQVSKGQGDMSNLDNQPGEDVASQSELDDSDSYSDLRALLEDSDPDSE